MTSKDAVRVMVRETAIHRFYASSPDLPGLNVYVREEGELVGAVARAIEDLWKDLHGAAVAAKPISGGPRESVWTWQLDPVDVKACA